MPEQETQRRGPSKPEQGEGGAQGAERLPPVERQGEPLKQHGDKLPHPGGETKESDRR